MTAQVLFVQGAGEGTHDNWDLKLVESLRAELGSGHQVLYPRMPDEGDPHYGSWRAALLETFSDLPDETVLVGHSIGAAILINVLAEGAFTGKLSAIALIAAPFVGENGWPSEEMRTPNDLGHRLPSEAAVFLYHGTADETVPVEHLELYARAIPKALVRRLEDRDHQLEGDLQIVARDILQLSNRA